MQLLQLERERRCKSVDQSSRQYRRTVWSGQAGLDNSELVAAETGQSVAGADHRRSRSATARNSRSPAG